jgi:hypothetical protein
MLVLTPTMLGSLLAGVALWLMFWYGVNHVDFPHISSPKVTCYGPDDQSKDGEGHIFQRRNVPSVFPVPVPQCREDKHRHAPVQDAFVKDVVFAALPANSHAILNLFRRESGWHSGSVASVACPAYTDEDRDSDRLRSIEFASEQEC